MTRICCTVRVKPPVLGAWRHFSKLAEGCDAVVNKNHGVSVEDYTRRMREYRLDHPHGE